MIHQGQWSWLKMMHMIWMLADEISPLYKEVYDVPTINQLVRKGRMVIEEKSGAPALQKGYNSFHKEQTDLLHHKNAACVPV